MGELWEFICSVGAPSTPLSCSSPDQPHLEPHPHPAQEPIWAQLQGNSFCVSCGIVWSALVSFFFFSLSLFSIIFFGLVFGLILDLSCHCRSLPQLLDGGWSPVFDLVLHCVPDMTSDVSCWMLIAVDADACSPSSAFVGWALALWGMLLNPCPYFL